MANSKVLCTGCDFHGSLAHRNVTLLYQLPDGSTFSTGRVFGWCDVCDAITNIEPKFEEAEIIQKIAALKTQTSGRSYKIGRLVNRVLGGESSESKEIYNLMQQLKLVKGRKSKPRCLRCGGEGVGILGAVPHKCGGKLYTVPADEMSPRFFYSPETIFLDVEGKKNDQMDLKGRATNLASSAEIEGVLANGLFNGFLIFLRFEKDDLKEIFTTPEAFTSFARIIELRIMHLDFESPLDETTIDASFILKDSASKSIRAVIALENQPVAKWFQSEVKKPN